MLLKENPFYILGASLYDDKATLQELADDKAWDDEEENGDIYERAATTLTNPKKRLAAEMCWFVGCSREEEKNFVKALDDGKYYGAALENPLARLNFELYIFGLNCLTMSHKSVYDMALFYDKLDAKEIQDTLNEARAEAGFPPISDTKDITAEIEKIRSEIRTSIQAAFKKLSHRQITTLADELADYIIDGSVILEDFFNKIYSPYVANLLDKHFKKFLDAAISLENNPTDSTFQILEKYLQDVCQVLKPIDKVKVISDTDLKNLSEKIFYRLRGIAIDWHNDKHLIDEPLKLLKILSANYLHVVEELKKIADKDIKILEDEKTARPSEIFVESEKILRNILDTVHNETYAKQGFDNENRKFYREFTQFYAARIFQCLNRSGYKPEELEILHLCASIIYNEMGIVLTYTPQIDLATKFFETAFEYAKKSNDIKYLKTVEENLNVCRQALSRRQNSGGCMIFILAVVTATLLNFI